jgi:hypothetical protein
MARPQVYNWPAADTAAICAVQSAVTNLVINGTQASRNPVGFPNTVEFPGILRSVSITSTFNLSGVNFTITGTYGNKIVSETRLGPTAGNTVYTTQLFSSVTAVSVSSAVGAVSIGSGNSGQTGWFSFNYHSTGPSLLTASISNVVGTINVAGATTLDDVNTNSNPFLFDALVLSSATADGFANCTIPITFATILVAVSSGSFTATLVQQGIT